MMNKKVLALALTLIFVFGLLTGCGGGATTSSTASTASSTPAADSGSASKPAASGDEIVLEFWNGFTGSDGEILTDIVNGFNEQYAGEFKINMDIMSWDVFYQKFNPSVAAGTAPNFVIASQNRIVMYANNGTYQTVDDLFTDYGVDEANILEANLDPCKYQDAYYALPMFNGFVFLWYNKDMFTEFGLDPEAPPTTLDELFDYATAMTDPAQGKYGFTVETTWISPSCAEWFWVNGGDVVDSGMNAVLNSAQNVEIMERLQTAVVQDGISPVGISFDESVELFLSGNLGMIYTGPWVLNNVRKSGLNFGTTGMPAGATNTQYGYTSCYGVTTANSDEERDGVMKYLAYWYSHDVQLKWSLDSGFPSYTKSVLEDPKYLEDDVQKSIAPFLENSRIFYLDVENMDIVTNDILWPSFQEIIIGGEDPQAVLDNANTRLEGFLDENAN